MRVVLGETDPRRYTRFVRDGQVLHRVRLRAAIGVGTVLLFILRGGFVGW